MAEHKKKYSNEQIIDALEKSNGLVFIAAKILGCTPQTIYNRADMSKAIRAAMDNARGEFVDAAEKKLMAAVTNGEPWAISFTLKMLGKSRGYTEAAKMELTGRDGAPIEVRDIEAVRAQRWKQVAPALAAAAETGDE